MEPTASYTEEQYSQVIGRLHQLVPTDLVFASSVAILIERGPQLAVLGSGTLFRIAEESFVITAAHVMKEGNGKNLHLIPSRGGSCDIIPLEGEAILDLRDAFDVAAVHLRPHVAEKIDPKRFLRLSNVSFAEDFAEGFFIVYGCPEMMFSHSPGNLKITLYHHGGPVYPRETSAIPHYDPSISLLLDADINETRGFDGKPIEFRYPQGPSAQFPTELKGMSGGSVWQLLRKPHDILGDSGNTRIVAVEVAICQPKRCIRATRWKAVAHMLLSEIPDLKPAFDMWRPA